MAYIILSTLAAFLLAVFCLAIAIKTAKARGEKIKELEESLESAKAEIQRQSEYQKKREEAQKNADEKKESLNTGNDAVDFDNILGVLHTAGKDRGS